MAMAFVEKAIIQGHPVRVWDHHSNHPNDKRILIDIIHGIVDKLNTDRKMDRFVIKYFQSDNSIQIYQESGFEEKMPSTFL